MAYRHKRRNQKQEDEPKEESFLVEREVSQPDPVSVEKVESMEDQAPDASLLVKVECPANVPEPAEKEEEVVEKKVKRKRKAKAEAPLVNPDGSEVVAPQPPVKKSRKEQLLDDFMITQLPALRKETKLRKKEQVSFNIREYSEYFKPGSEWTPTYCLGLFNFLGKNEILCEQYGVFEKSKHMVKTSDGFNHASIIQTSVGELLTPDEINHMMSCFGRSWFKIPASDAPNVSTAYRLGAGHQFKVILTGIYEGSFYGKDGEEVHTINPKLRYEPYRAPPEKVKKEKKSVEPVIAPTVDQPVPENVSEIL